MSRKSHKDFKHSNKEEQPEKQQEEQSGADTNKDVTEKQTDSEIPEDQQLKDKIDELNDKYLRLYSEFDNYRRRTSKERIELGKTASAEIITDLLPVLDDFERAIKSTIESQDCNAVKEGVNLIFSKFRGILEKKGVKPIEAIGQEFNTDYHEAITYIPAPDEELKNKIVDEVEKGYLLGDKVIRYSKVIIGQ
jgi:molecular chaperone GrpE